jgi:hypothetical protein
LNAIRDTERPWSSVISLTESPRTASCKLGCDARSTAAHGSVPYHNRDNGFRSAGRDIAETHIFRDQNGFCDLVPGVADATQLRLSRIESRRCFGCRLTPRFAKTN